MAKKRAFRGFAMRQKATWTIIDNIKFRSKAEAKRYVYLKALFDRGEISCLKLQPRFELAVNGVYITEYRGDFSYIRGDDWVVEDVKYIKHDAYIMKARLMLAVYGIQIVETR